MKVPDQMDAKQLQVAELNWVESLDAGRERELPGAELRIMQPNWRLQRHICSLTKPLDQVR